MKNIAKLTSYGCYLDCDFTTAKYPDDKTHIVGNLAEYVYDLEHEVSNLRLQVKVNDKHIVEQNKEIENLKKFDELNKNFFDLIKNSFKKPEKFDDLFETLKNFQEKNDKDKVIFCVKHLEKIKNICKEKFNWWENSEYEGNLYDKSDVSNAYYDIEANIDYLIEQLKARDNEKM